MPVSAGECSVQIKSLTSKGGLIGVANWTGVVSYYKPWPYFSGEMLRNWDLRPVRSLQTAPITFNFAYERLEGALLILQPSISLVVAHPFICKFSPTPTLQPSYRSACRYQSATLTIEMPALKPTVITNSLFLASYGLIMKCNEV